MSVWNEATVEGRVVCFLGRFIVCRRTVWLDLLPVISCSICTSYTTRPRKLLYIVCKPIDDCFLDLNITKGENYLELNTLRLQI